MKIDSIQEAKKEFTIRLCDEMNDFEDIAVVMPSEFTKPQSPYFTHCEVKINTLRHRTISQHISNNGLSCIGAITRKTRG